MMLKKRSSGRRRKEKNSLVMIFLCICLAFPFKASKVLSLLSVTYPTPRYQEKRERDSLERERENGPTALGPC